MSHAELLIGIAVIFVFGIGAQWISSRLRIPSILLLLILGFVAGPVTGLVRPDEMFGDLFFIIVPLAVAVVLFEGGTSLSISEVTGHGTVVRRLISIGVLVTWGLAAGAAVTSLGLEPGIAVLLGAVVVVSGPTVVGPLLRSVKPTSSVRTVLNWEGILIDPVGATLAVIVFDILIAGEGSLRGGLGAAISTVGVGLLVGLIGAGVIVLLLKRYLIPDHLQPSATLMFVVAAFVASDLLRPESGLLAVTLMGIAVANQKFVSVEHIIEFKETLRELLIAGLFIVLAARLEMEDILDVGWRETLFLIVLVFVARPLAVFISTIGSELAIRERLFVSWVAPRGIVAAAVASVFAIELEEAGIADASRLVPLTFFVIIGTVALYSLTARLVGKMLGVVEEDGGGLVIVGANPVARELAKSVAATGVDVQLVATNHSELTKARMEGLRAFRTSVLDDDEDDEDQTGSDDLVLLATPNDEFNALAAIRAIESRDRSQVYQLAPSVGSERVATRLRARILVSLDFSFTEVSEQMLAGAVFRTTELTDQFQFADYTKKHGPSATPIFVIERGSIVGVFSADSTPSPASGQTIVSLMAPVTPEPPMIDEDEVIEAMAETETK